MGLLDELQKNLAGAATGGTQTGGGQGALLQTVLQLLQGGGLQQLVSSFQQKGLGDLIGSWVSTGPNRPISPDQVEQALGPDKLGQLAQQTGIDTGALASQLSNLLPGLVDKLTPDGKVPEGGALQEKLGGLLKGFLQP